jgi:hypothetical protein
VKIEECPLTDFDDDTKTILAQAGSVGLPYPSPASGPLYLGINLDQRAPLRSAPPHYYLRVVQAVSPRQVITRIVDLEELRGVSLPGVDLRLMFLDGDITSIPTCGTNLVIVAATKDGVRLRIFGSRGEYDSKVEEKGLKEPGPGLPELRDMLPGLRPPHVLTCEDTDRVLALVTSIVGKTCLPRRQDGATRVFKTVNQIAGDILGVRKSLDAIKGDGTGGKDMLLYPDAVIFVGETAPVYVRIQYEFGITAAEAAENVECLLQSGSCPCPTEKNVW